MRSRRAPYSEEKDRRSTHEVELERADNGELTLKQKRMGVPSLDELRKLPSVKDGADRYWVRLADSRVVCYRNTPRVQPPELYEEIQGFGIVSEVFQVTKSTWIVWLD